MSVPVLGKLGDQAVGIGGSVGGGFCQDLSEAKITDMFKAGGKTRQCVLSMIQQLLSLCLP